MNQIFKTILCIVFLTGFLVTAQDRKEKKAQSEFENYAYQDAIESYEGLIDQGYSDEQIFKNLGNAYYLNGRYIEAASWYSKLFRLEDTEIESDYMYRYAQSLKSNGEYIAADIWMKKLETANEQDIRVQKYNDRQDYLDKINKLSGRYTIKNLSINSTESDFAPSFYGENLVFATARDTGTTLRQVNEWTNKSFLNLYMAKPRMNGKFSAPDELSRTMNKKTHESTTAFTKDGKTLYFTRNNSTNGKFARDKDGVSRLKIYRAILENGEWTDIAELPFNSDEYSVAHPALSPDGRKLYFASDMEGTLGKSDIFFVDINTDGSFGAPKNLGPKINTESRETFPFVSANNILYFASDGHPGLGGLDIFAANINDMENLRVTNIGKPINGLEDDFTFIIDEATKKGYFASNRKGGRGGDDIYTIVENKTVDFNCNTVIVDGIVKDEETGKPLAGALVVIFDSESTIIAETFSADDGSFVLEGPCKGDDYTLVVSNDRYGKEDILLAIIGEEDTKGIEIGLEKIIGNPSEGTDLITFLGLEPIYFDLNKDVIRPDAKKTLEKVIEYLKWFPTLKVQIQSHTDARAGDSYNMRLSKRRAKNTVKYFTAHGIQASRISGEGFGETRLINNCDTKESCSDERHQENRRSEIVVIE